MGTVTTVQRLRANASDAYPQRKKLPKLPRDRGERRWFRTLLKLIGLGILTALVGGGSIIGYAWNTMALPPDAPLAQTTFVTDSGGKPLTQFNAGENRTPVDLDAIPVVLRESVIATEDRSFYKHKGVDPRGLGRAIYVDLRGKGGTQGGSTLTQQYVKTVYVGTDRTLWRKFKEAVLAVKLEQKYSKDEILNRYLNVVYFGRGAYGVQAASQAYFGKDVGQLELKESAYLAGLLRAPELADATTNPEVAKQRRDLTLNSMMQTGLITDEKRKEVSDIDLASYVTPKSQKETTTVGADKGTQYFVDYVKKILIARYGEQRVLSGGLQIKTTLDMNMQTKAYDSVYGYLKPTDPASALVTLDSNGAVKAMVGGRDYKTSKVNLATGRDGGGSGRQAGSTFKPFTLAAAVEDGVCYRESYRAPASIKVVGADNGKDWNVSNYEDETAPGGYTDLLYATAHSINTVYAQLNVQIGAEKTAAMAQAAGITSPVGQNVANVLGTSDVSPLEMADAYLTFSQNGLHVDANPILEVKNPEGEVLERAKPVKTRVMEQDTAQAVNLALQGVVREGTGAGARLSGNRPLAGKTGTTENSGDAWFVGYTPTLTTAVWMGYPDGSAHQMHNIKGYKDITGGTVPATMFGNYMNQVAPTDNKTFTAPPTCRPDRGQVFSSPDDTTTTTTPRAATGQDDTTGIPGFPQLPEGLQDLGQGNGLVTGDGTDRNGTVNRTTRGQATRDENLVSPTTPTTSRPSARSSDDEDN